MVRKTGKVSEFRLNGGRLLIKMVHVDGRKWSTVCGYIIDNRYSWTKY